MALMGRPKERPEHAKPGQYYCRHNEWDAESGRAVVCGKDVPSGPLTWLALNSRSGYYLALCPEHRQALDEAFEEWASTQVGAARLLSTYTRLPEGELVSESDLREVLKNADGRAPNRGPLPQQERLRAIELMHGADVRAMVEEMERS